MHVCVYCVDSGAVGAHGRLVCVCCLFVYDPLCVRCSQPGVYCCGCLL